MSSTRFRVEALSTGHDRASFTCGEEALDHYFQHQVSEDIRRHLANCFVAVDNLTDQAAAYYTISAASIPLTDLPHEDARRLPRYPTIPAVRVGRLAVHVQFHGQGVGAALLADAAERTLRAPAAAFALLVDAKNEGAIAFYRHFGFRSLASRPATLFLPLATARKALPKRST